MLKIFWFRKDLRTKDNRALSEFIKDVSEDDEYLFLYIKNSNTFSYFGEKRICFLYECLNELNNELSEYGQRLNIFEGNSRDVFYEISGQHKNFSVWCNEQVEPYCRTRDLTVRDMTEACGGSFNSFSDTTIFRPCEIKNGSGDQYKVYTPFKNQCLNILKPDHYKSIDTDLNPFKERKEFNIKGIRYFNTEKTVKNLKGSQALKGGRSEGLGALKRFYENGMRKYRSQRDLPSVSGTSMLSAHLHFGTVSIREVLRTAYIRLKGVKGEAQRNEIQTWINELLWREFYYHIAYHNPKITYRSFRPEYDRLKWNYDEKVFKKWCEGQTGVPIVDAGMRQLNQEGWMHNRVRMITAMYLTKDLFIDWRLGEKYFAEKLIDLDFSSNNGGWQWSASTGVDPQPYFRIFNPYLQSRKFDPEGLYIKKYVPELKSLPEGLIHEPNIMTDLQQKMYSVEIGKDYPLPLIDHKTAAKDAIKKFKEISNFNDNNQS